MVLATNAQQIRRHILNMVFKASAAHVGSSFSIVEILAVLYFSILKIDPQNPREPNRDIFVLSKGHAVAALYATLAERGFFDKTELNKFCQDGSKIAGHVIKDSFPGIEVTAGSLGHGLAITNGLALANKNNERKFFCLLGDGECNEGAVWEAAMFGAQHDLSKLVAIVDVNNQQGLGETEKIINNSRLSSRWAAFGWEVKEADGHNIKELAAVFDYFINKKNKSPSVLLAHTIKGKGVSFMENNIAWHYKNPNAEEYRLALNELSK